MKWRYFMIKLVNRKEDNLATLLKLEGMTERWKLLISVADNFLLLLEKKNIFSY